MGWRRKRQSCDAIAVTPRASHSSGEAHSCDTPSAHYTDPDPFSAACTFESNFHVLARPPALQCKCFTGTGMVDPHNPNMQHCLRATPEPRKVSSLDNSLKLALLQGVGAISVKLYQALRRRVLENTPSSREEGKAAAGSPPQAVPASPLWTAPFMWTSHCPQF